MSYILDALRKADAQRESDPARGIHAQPVSPAPSARSQPQWPVWVTSAAVVVVSGVLLLVEWREPATQAQPAPAAAGPRSSNQATPAATATATPAPPAPVVVASAVQPPAPATPAVMQPLAPPVAAVSPTPRVAMPPVPVAPTATAPTPAGAPGASQDRVLTVAELPADVQRDLPKLAITGGVHSDNASQRMLIVGGQVMSEGAELAPGVVLEQIRPKSAVLRFRGLRYSVGY